MPNTAGTIKHSLSHRELGCNEGEFGVRRASEGAWSQRTKGSGSQHFASAETSDASEKAGQGSAGLALQREVEVTWDWQGETHGLAGRDP